jgi:hypothetical protein
MNQLVDIPDDPAGVYYLAFDPDIYRQTKDHVSKFLDSVSMHWQPADLVRDASLVAAQIVQLYRDAGRQVNRVSRLRCSIDSIEQLRFVVSTATDWVRKQKVDLLKASDDVIYALRRVRKAKQAEKIIRLFSRGRK